MEFERVLTHEELWDGEMRSLYMGNRKVLLYRLNGEVLAYEDRCLHRGVPLSEGCLKGNVLTCSAHHWQFDLGTGESINPKNKHLKRFQVRLESDGIYVEGNK